MFEGDGLAAVEFGPQRLECRIAEVSARVAGHQDHAVGVQRAERVLDFGQGAVDVGERQRREAAEPVGPPGDQIGGVFVDAARHLPPLIVGPAHDTGRADREDPGRDLLGVHEVDGALGRPVRSYAARRVAAMAGQRLRVEGRHDMLVNIDAMSTTHGLLLCS